MADVEAENPQPIIKVGDTVTGKYGEYKLSKLLGQGTFGAVFEVCKKKTNNIYALKMELILSREDEPGLDLEAGVLKRIQNSIHAVRYIDSGKIDKLSYVIMQLVGCNLSDLRKACPDHHFTLNSALRLGLQCLDGVEAMHSAGLLHRDIKPSNFALGRTVKDIRNVYILDFGLVRRYRLKDGSVRPARTTCGFRGTSKYVSLNVHDKHDWGRVDDVWCWLYTLVEFQSGGLPWRHESERDKIRDIKVEYKTKLFKGLELENIHISYNLDTLKYADEPPYHWYRQQLGQIMQRKAIHSDDLYDWEPKGPYHKQLKDVCPQPYDSQMKEAKNSVTGKERTSEESISEES